MQAAEDASVFVEGLSKRDFMADRHSEVPWRQIRGMRNRLVHGYFEVNLDVVWETTQTAIPKLRQSLAGIDPDANPER
jgi:uncharacterized protein with HEPN domain